MMARNTGAVWLAVLALAGGHSSDAAGPKDVDPDHAAKMMRGREVFAKHVRPLLVEHCAKCHGGDKTRSGLDLVTREALLKGRDKGAVVVPGKASESRLYPFPAHPGQPPM